jgi:hypothetical protein
MSTASVEDERYFYIFGAWLSSTTFGFFFALDASFWHGNIIYRMSSYSVAICTPGKYANIARARH